MFELEDRNPEHKDLKAKVVGHCNRPQGARITKTALNDLGLEGITKHEVLAALGEHIESGRRVFKQILDSGEQAFVVPHCEVSSAVLYVKVKFFKYQGQELMVIVSAHPPRKW